MSSKHVTSAGYGRPFRSFVTINLPQLRALDRLQIKEYVMNVNLVGKVLVWVLTAYFVISGSLAVFNIDAKLARIAAVLSTIADR